MKTLFKTCIVLIALGCAQLVNAQKATETKDTAVELYVKKGEKVWERSYTDFQEIFDDQEMVDLGLDKIIKYENNELILIDSSTEKILLTVNSNFNSDQFTQMTLEDEGQEPLFFKVKIKDPDKE